MANPPSTVEPELGNASGGKTEAPTEIVMNVLPRGHMIARILLHLTPLPSSGVFCGYRLLLSCIDPPASKERFEHHF
jgi:hypothetical protein